MIFEHILCLEGFRIVFDGASAVTLNLLLLRYLVCAATTARTMVEMVMKTMLIMIMRMSSGNGMHMTRFMIMYTGMSKQMRRMSESRPVGAESNELYVQMDHRMETKAPARRHGMNGRNGSRPDGNGIRPDGME